MDMDMDKPSFPTPIAILCDTCTTKFGIVSLRLSVLMITLVERFSTAFIYNSIPCTY